jgi:hypothetical protein
MQKITQWRISALLIVLIASSVFYISKSKYNPTSRYSICKNFYKQQFKGVINDISEGNLRKPIYILESNEWFTPFPFYNKIEGIIEIGDSIYKPSGTFKLYIYKSSNSDSVIFLSREYYCDSLVEDD